MSVKAMSAAFEAGDLFGLSAIDRLILLRIADWADDYGYAFPGIDDLVGKVGVDERTIRRHITGLADARFIDRVYGGGGRNRTTLYRVLPLLLPDSPDAPGRRRYETRYRLTVKGDGEPAFLEVIKGTGQTGKGGRPDRKGGRNSVPRSVNIHHDPSAFEIEEPEIPRLPGETPSAYLRRLALTD